MKHTVIHTVIHVLLKHYRPHANSTACDRASSHLDVPGPGQYIGSPQSIHLPQLRWFAHRKAFFLFSTWARWVMPARSLAFRFDEV